MVRLLENNDSLITEVFGAIAHFIDRQKLVAQVVKDLDIDLEDVGKYGATIWSQQGNQELLLPLSTPASDQARGLWKAVQRARCRKPVAQQGIWGDSEEWIYFLHGKGCRLRNVLTGEVINWDCPDVEAFDPYFFLDHLRWRLETEKESSLPNIKEQVALSSDGLESIIQTIEQMKTSGLINPDWTLSGDFS